MKDTCIRVRISETDKEKLRQLADESQMSMSEWIINQIRMEAKESKIMKATVKSYNNNFEVYLNGENIVTIYGDNCHDFTAEENINEFKEQIDEYDISNRMELIWAFEIWVDDKSEEPTKEELEIAILMADRCTKSEAKKHLKNGTVVRKESEVNDLLKELNEFQDEDEKYTIDDIKAGVINDISYVTYKGKKYFIEYVL